jgi:hypothetical protein
MRVQVDGRIPDESPELQRVLRELAQAVKLSVDGGIDYAVTPFEYGAVGDGSTDDTAAIQAALDTTSRLILFPAGYTFVTGEVTSNVAGRTITAEGATIKLKAGANPGRILTIFADRTTVRGGEWDGNKANVSVGNAFSSWAVSFEAVEYCELSGAYIHSFRGAGVKGFNAQYCYVHDNVIEDIGHAAATTCYGVYLEANGAPKYGNRVNRNVIDLSSNGTSAQPILLTSVLTNYQLGWQIKDNDIRGSTDAANADLAICIGARGHRGVVTGNVTTGGSMGFSEGGDDCVITNNNISELVGSIRWGIEPTGSRCTITGNTITDCIIGISSSTNAMDQMTLGNNTIICDAAVTVTIGIQLQVPSGQTGRDINISGGTIKARRGVVTTRDVTGLTISGVTFRGPGSGTSGGRGVFLDTPETAAHVYITGCTFAGFERAYSLFNASAVTHTNLYALGNIKANDIGANTSGWHLEGSAALGSGTVVDAWGVSGTTGRYHITDQANNVRVIVGINGSPESVETAGVGSMATRRDGAAGTTMYMKNSGTGNTGWGALS